MDPAWAMTALGGAALSAALALNDAMLLHILVTSAIVSVFPAFSVFFIVRAIGGAITAAARHDPATGDAWSLVSSACASLVVTQDGVTTWALIVSSIPIIRAASSFDASLVKRAISETPTARLFFLLAVRFLVEGVATSDVSVAVDMAREYASQVFKWFVALAGLFV